MFFLIERPRYMKTCVCFYANSESNLLYSYPIILDIMEKNETNFKYNAVFPRIITVFKLIDQIGRST
jgi:hypothetical protein